MTTSPFYRSVGGGVLAACLLALGAPAQADVKSGVDAWSAGDYATAVREWSGPAQAGDADAQFNLGQAYRLGRGVEADKEQAEAVLVASLDCSAAFDTIGHGILLQKLERACGVEGPALELFRSYLGGRKQRTRTSSGLSDWRDTSGRSPRVGLGNFLFWRISPCIFWGS